MNLRGLIIGAVTLLVALIVLALLSREQSGKNQSSASVTAALQATRSDYYMEGVVSRHFDLNGQLSHVLIAPRIDHFQDQKRSLMQQPRIQLARPDGVPWEVSAELADAEHSSEKLTLRQQVSLSRSAVAGVAPLRMETDMLIVDMQARTADTSSTVHFSGANGKVSATGLRANLTTEQLELLSNVKGHYEQHTP
jgi:lipopolysaccharide export system protein LptC